MPYSTIGARRLLVFALSLSGACGGPPPDDAATAGALGEQNVGQNCNGFLGIGDSCDRSGPYPYQSTNADGKCVCRATPCTVSGTLHDELGAAHPELTLLFTTAYDQTSMHSDPDGNFLFHDVVCSDQSWLTVTSSSGVELFPSVAEAQTRLAPDSRTNPTGIAMTVYLHGNATEGPDAPPAGSCIDPFNGAVIADGACTHDPSNPSDGRRCDQGKVGSDPSCALSSCTWGSATYWEMMCEPASDGQLWLCQHDSTWTPVDTCPAGSSPDGT
jgi:hypothetical protein